MKFIIMLIFLMSAISAIGAPRVNSGGGGWACRKNDGSGQVIWIKAADLIKDEFYNTQGLKEKSGERWALLRERHQLIAAKVPTLAKLLADHPLNIQKKLFAMPVALNYVPDAQLRYKPPGISCPGGVVSYVQLADTTMDGKVIYSTRVWDQPGFSEFQKAAILLHEEIYFALRETYGDDSSYRTRQIMGLLYSIDDEIYLLSEIKDVLDSKTRVRKGIFGFQNAPALFNVQPKCSVTVNGGPEVSTWVPKNGGDRTDLKLQGFQFHIATLEVDGSPQSLQITDEASQISAALDNTETSAVFNALRRASVTLKRGQDTVTLSCESTSALDEDAL